MYQLTSGRSLPINPNPGEMEEPNEWLKLWRTLVRRRTAFFAIAATTFAVVLLLTVVMPRQYTTTVEFIAGSPGGSAPSSSDASSILPYINSIRAASSGTQTPETYARLFQETPVAQQVIDDLKLDVKPGVIQGNVVVKPVTNTSILTVAVTWKDADTSARIANDLASVFVQRERDLVASQAGSALQYLDAEMPKAKQRLNETATALAQYEANNHIADIATQTSSVLANIGAVDTKIAAVEVDERQAQAQLGATTAQVNSMNPSIASGQQTAVNPILQNLQTQLAQQEVALKNAQDQYTDQHPTVIGLKEQVAQLKREIASTPQTVVASNQTAPNPVYEQLSQQAAGLRSQIAADGQGLAELKRQRAAFEPQLRNLPGQQNRLADLKRDAKSAEDIYNALQQKYNEANAAKDSVLSDITVTQRADPEAASVKPDVKLNLVVGTLIALILGFSGAFIIDYFDNSIKDEDDVARELALPVLATIPRLEQKGKYALPWIRSLTIESFLQLVTSLRYASDTPVRTMTFTSPLQGDGKSSVALNTAIAMAEVQPRILLIDADLRRPSLHAKLNVRNDRGLSDLLVGTAAIEEVTRTTRHGGLDLITAGTRTPNPFKLLQSDRFEEFLETALNTYKTIIIDGPALGPVIDGAILSAKTDGTVLVVAAGGTDMRSTKRALTRLQGVGVKNILGVVVNKATPRRADYTDYYLEGGTHTTLSLPDDSTA